MITFKYRLYPNKSQQNKLWEHANRLNSLYNYFLDQKIKAYKNEKNNINQSDLQKQLPALKTKDPLLKEIHSQVLQQVAIRLEKSFDNFFRRVKNHETPGFPKFRKCSDFFGICYPQSGFSIKDGVFTTKAYKDITFKQHRKYKGNIRQVSITFSNNMWFLNIITDHVVNNNSNKNINTLNAVNTANTVNSTSTANNKSNKKEVGIDLGLKNLVVASDGYKIPNCTHAKYFDKQIAKVQKARDNKTKGSNTHKHLSGTMQSLYGAKNRKIDDFQHKVSKHLAQTYDIIFAEDLSVKKMSEGNITSLNKSIRNAKLGQFISFLGYKAETLILVNPVNTSKKCNSCGYIHHNLKLSDRTIRCRCGSVYDRDENAAKNVLCLGQTMSKKCVLGSK